MSTREPVLDVRGVTREVVLPDGATLRILKGVDLRVGAGERIAVLGRSGAGKTTLLNLLGLIDRPTSGSIRFRGSDSAGLGENALARLRGRSVGFVFQQFNLLEGRTAHENVVMPLLYGGPAQFWQRDRLAREMLAEVGLGGRGDQLPRQLSGGEQQRVAIARAMASEPQIIFADEPTGNLDTATGHAIIELIFARRAALGATLLIITHDPELADHCDRVVVMHDGRIEER